MKNVIDSFFGMDKDAHGNLIEREVQLVEENGKESLYCTFTGVGLKRVNLPEGVARETFEELRAEARAMNAEERAEAKRFFGIPE